MSHPTPLHRGTHPAPASSRRDSSLPVVEAAPSSNVPKVLAGALTILACKRCLQDNGNGGVGWLVVSLWVGRGAQVIWKRVRRRAPLRPAADKRAIAALSLLLIAQSSAYFHTLVHLSPLRTLLVTASTAAYVLPIVKQQKSTWQICLPALAAVFWTIWFLATSSGFASAIPLLSHTLLAVINANTLQPFLDSALRTSSSEKDVLTMREREREQTRSREGVMEDVVLWSAALSLPFVLSEWSSGVVDYPIPSLTPTTTNAYPLLALLAPVLLQFLPTTTVFIHAPLAAKPTGLVAYIAGLVVLNLFVFPPLPAASDALLAVPILITLFMLPTPDQFLPPQNATVAVATAYGYTPHTHTPEPSVILRASWIPPSLRAHLKEVLKSPEASKIFYFALLNAGFMLVQLLWGVWTNSLGLISDAIHMAFDCLALGVGLYASVMASWQPDERYSFGYGRVETLSGFANGCFLILISVFIIFEAIQRVIDPPEMNTNQLLLVSSLGLAINLWGMYATGGHHHHGHSHGHAHSHDDHSHGAKHTHGDDCDHDTGHGHSHGGHDHGHSHNMRGVFLHVLADTLGSVGVIISTILIRWTGYTVFDPIASLFIAALIVASVIPLVIDTGKVLCLDVGTHHEKDIRAALSELSQIEGLASYGAPRFWPKSESELIGSLHIHLAPSASNHDPSRGAQHAQYSTSQNLPTIYANADKVVSRVERALRRRIPALTELVVQIEGIDERFCTCMTSGR